VGSSTNASTLLDCRAQQRCPMPEDATPYSGLSPDLILDSLEAHGFAPTGSLLALNSYENRVYQLELADGSFCVAKFYRPNRWSDAQILEEHAFTQELIEHDLSAVGPWERDGTTLFGHNGFRFAVFPRQGGRAPNIDITADLKVLARSLARLHSVGQVRAFQTRPAISAQRLGVESRQFLLEQAFVPAELVPAYDTITEQLLAQIIPLFDAMATGSWKRIHGDCHLGNLLWRDNTAHFVDFDDCVNGPPIQDLWMLLSGERHEQESQLSEIMEAYSPFADFDFSNLILIEPLRTLRIMHHAAWIARRWDDPAFPRAFPWYNTDRYWSDHILDLREQLAILNEPPLSLR
jgi:Ser/Thr protein kinase RdoA (MazF antagonist)